MFLSRVTVVKFPDTGGISPEGFPLLRCVGNYGNRFRQRYAAESMISPCTLIAVPPMLKAVYSFRKICLLQFLCKKVNEYATVQQ